MPGIDTLHQWLPAEEAGAYSLSDVTANLEGLEEHIKDDGRSYISGILANTFRVSISDSGISLKGSLPKYFLNDNLHTLTRSDAERAIERLQDDLHLPLMKATVTRLDFAGNLTMQYQPETYYPYLGDCRYYKRFSQPNSVYWSNGRKGGRTKLVYNKALEARAKGLMLPDVIAEANLLRYEMRYTGRLTKHLNRPQVACSTLVDEQFHIALCKRWLAEYEDIHKLNSINLNLSEMNSPKDFFKQMALLSIKEIGEQRAIDFVEEMRAMKAFTKPEYYSRVKRGIKALCKASNASTSNGLIEELDKKVRDAVRYYR